MDIMDIRDIMDIMDIMDIVIMIITAWMAMAGAVSALVFLFDKVVGLVGGGSVINGAYPV